MREDIISRFAFPGSLMSILLATLPLGVSLAIFLYQKLPFFPSLSWFVANSNAPLRISHYCSL
jgi:hypothetical protein